ncbi:hypothetical protein BJ165DRAFT_1505160 [Panaeolus papilionaceus]|nr:hypothetical protein BJ165DRAFT_1505160 [Panaeolus papilionaceus]
MAINRSRILDIQYQLVERKDKTPPVLRPVIMIIQPIIGVRADGRALKRALMCW